MKGSICLLNTVFRGLINLLPYSCAERCSSMQRPGQCQNVAWDERSGRQALPNKGYELENDD